MNFKDLVKWVRSQGCKVTVYKNKKTIEDCLGVFYEDPEPHIKLATKNRPLKKKVSVLLHEYAHFLQWRDGFSKYLDGICWPHSIFHDWVEIHVELTQREIKMCRNSMLFIEYDADMRAFDIGMAMKPDGFDPAYHLSDAQSYCNAIKWAWKNRKEWRKRPGWKMWPARRLTHEELFAPLTEAENKILEKIKAKKD